MTTIPTPRAKLPPTEHLPGLPRRALTPQQQMEAIARVQDQAEQRVKLGLQLFKAVEAHTSSNRKILEEIQAEREKLRDEMTEDFSRTLHTYDQWIGQMDDTYSQALLALEQRVNDLEASTTAQCSKLQQMIDQTQRLLQQATSLLENEAAATAAAPATHTLSPAPAAARPSYQSLLHKLHQSRQQLHQEDAPPSISTP